MDIYSADRNVWSGVFCIVICISDTKIIKMNTLVIQYIVIGALLLFACFRVWKIFQKTLVRKKAVVATKTAGVHKSCP